MGYRLIKVPPEKMMTMMNGVLVHFLCALGRPCFMGIRCGLQQQICTPCPCSSCPWYAATAHARCASCSIPTTCLVSGRKLDATSLTLWQVEKKVCLGGCRSRKEEEEEEE